MLAKHDQPRFQRIDLMAWERVFGHPRSAATISRRM
jgi:hypothetical protein